MNVSYATLRSARRPKLTITVERDRSVVVHAPEGYSDDKIRKVVESKRQWIHEKIRHPQKYQALPHPPGKELVSGESALYLGRQYRIEMIKSSSARVQFSQRFLILASQGSKRVEALRDWYTSKAGEKTVPGVKLHARQLGVDVAGKILIQNDVRILGIEICASSISMICV